MIRDICTTEELTQYSNNFLINDLINLEVHPWVAESWRYSKEQKISHKKFFLRNNIIPSPEVLKYPLHKIVINYMTNFFNSIREPFAEYQLSMLLTDNKNCLLKTCNNYDSITPTGNFSYDNCVDEESIGTSSWSIVSKYKKPFMLFGQEMWQTELQCDDFISVPIFFDEKLLYILTFSFPTGRTDFNFIYLSLLNIKYSLEEYLKLAIRSQAIEEVLDIMDATLYYVRPVSTVEHTNKRGRELLGDEKSLSDAYINYQYIPIEDAFDGKKTIHEEQTWFTQLNRYSELTTILPVTLPNIDDIPRVVSLGIPIRKLKELNARTYFYDDRKSLKCIPATNSHFLKVKEKAIALAKKKNIVLLEGESGSALSRLAYGMHQISPYASGHFIIFPYLSTTSGHTKDIYERLVESLLIVNRGTLFIDDIEKYSVAESEIIVDALKNHVGKNKQNNFRLIVGANSNVKVLTTKGLFSKKLYNMLKAHVLKIPPLRDRPEDVVAFANFILQELSDKLKIQPRKKMSPAALKLVTDYSWPGNIMELAFVMQLAFFKTTGNVVFAENIKIPQKDFTNTDWKKNKETFIQMWKLSGGKITDMANLLNVSRITLYRYLHKFNLLEDREA